MKKLFYYYWFLRFWAKEKILGIETLHFYCLKDLFFFSFFIVIVFWDFEQKKRFWGGGNYCYFAGALKILVIFKEFSEKKIFGGSFIVFKNLFFFLLFLFSEILSKKKRLWELKNFIFIVSKIFSFSLFFIVIVLWDF